VNINGNVGIDREILLMNMTGISGDNPLVGGLFRTTFKNNAIVGKKYIFKY